MSKSYTFTYDVGERVGVYRKAMQEVACFPADDGVGTVRRILLSDDAIEYHVECDDTDTRGDCYWFTEDELYPIGVM